MEHYMENMTKIMNEIIDSWHHQFEYNNPPPGIVVEYVGTANDFKLLYKVFSESLSKIRLEILDGILDIIPTDVWRFQINPHLNSLLISASEKQPVFIASNQTTSTCAAQVNQFILMYTVLRIRSRMGEAILACYPRCGIPCGWDEREGVLYLYQPKIQQ